MRSTMTYRRGDVVLVPFPFTDLRGSKQRPAVVVSTDNYNQTTNDLILAQVTSNLRRPRFGDHQIIGLSPAGLPKPSLVRAKLATIEASRVIKTLGQMPPSDMRGIESTLKTALLP